MGVWGQNETYRGVPSLPARAQDNADLHRIGQVGPGPRVRAGWGQAVKELKLDRIFIAGLTGGDSGCALDLVRATIDLGHALGLRIVAEGIEDYATLELLSDLGCDLGQGNFISMPKPAHRLTFKPKLAGSQPATSVR